MSEDDLLYEKSAKRADDKISFYHHLYAFIAANIVFIIMNAITSPGEWWFYWITAFWAIGLIMHFLKVFVFTGKLEDNRDQMIENEMKKLKK